MFLERTLEPGWATAESVKRFNVRFSWPKSFLFFFEGDEFSDSKECSGS